MNYLFIEDLVINYLLVCGITFPFEFYYVNHHFSFRGKWICKTFRFLNYVFVHNSVLVLHLMAIERFRRVCCPLKAQMSTRWGECVSLGALFSRLFTLRQIYSSAEYIKWKSMVVECVFYNPKLQELLKVVHFVCTCFISTTRGYGSTIGVM